MINIFTIAGVTILLSMTIFLNTVQMIIPITSDSPLIGRNKKWILYTTFYIIGKNNEKNNFVFRTENLAHMLHFYSQHTLQF